MKIALLLAACLFAAEPPKKKPAKPEEVKTVFLPEKGEPSKMITKDQCRAIKKKKGKFPGACKIHGLEDAEPGKKIHP